MSARWNVAALLEPITPDEPCGKSLEETGELAQLDAFQIFGQDTLLPPEVVKGAPRPQGKLKAKSDRPPDWNELGDLAFPMLTKSKDLRVLAHLGAAVLWLEGPKPFAAILTVASRWLADHWVSVFPLIDEDAVLRRSALNCFADRAAIIEGLRRTPLVESRQHGRYSLRHLEISAGSVAPTESEPPPEEARIAAAFAEMPIADLQALHASVGEGLAALTAIEEFTRTAAGIEAAPSFESTENNNRNNVVAQMRLLETALQGRIAAHPNGVAPGETGDGEPVAGGAGTRLGPIRSRQDAIRALEAAADFFRRNEPSSPVPLIVDRAKRLIAKDFLEVIAEVAPEALAAARAAGGIRD